MEYGKAIRVHRGEKGVNRTELAEKLGLTWSAIVDIECGRLEPSGEMFAEIMSAISEIGKQEARDAEPV